jgi:two-component system C4-dicarboxylate transport sensor histidine kinase DctB
MLNKSKKILQQNKTDTPCIDLHLSRENKRCVLNIYDNGGCIPEQELGKVFEPYSVSGTRGAGTGMELHMAKLVIERKMNGKLKVRNRDGGVEFRIEL